VLLIFNVLLVLCFLEVVEGADKLFEFLAVCVNVGQKLLWQVVLPFKLCDLLFLVDAHPCERVPVFACQLLKEIVLRLARPGLRELHSLRHVEGKS